MKLVVQIPCYNEAETLPQTLAEIPRQIPGIDRVEVLVVDDGSTDGTAEVARRHGADHVVRHPRNRGLAAAFQTALDTALALGADIVVNTDGDNQYPGSEIPRLIAPILEGRADIVIADRQPHRDPRLPPLKRLLQFVGSWVVRRASGTRVPDAPSGFRAFSREAALRTVILNDYTYTLESIIAAGKRRLAIEHIVVRTNPTRRKSRLMKSVWDYVKRSGSTVVRVYATFEPLKTFTYVGLIPIVLGSLLVLRFLYHYFTEPITLGRFLQSLILAAVLLIVGFQTLLIGLLADLIGANRRLLEDIDYRVRRLELDPAQGVGVPPRALKEGSPPPTPEGDP